MKRLLSVALMVLVTLVGMVGVSSAAADPAMQSVITQLKNIQQSLDAISSDQLQVAVNTTNGAVGTLQTPGNAGIPVRPKMYYLTKNSFAGGDAITACDSGFHMASISEIQDPSNLQYATRSTPANDATPYDQVYGPPSDYMGWVTTGSSPIEGGPDYGAYSMSSFDRQSGTTATLYILMNAPQDNDPTYSYTTRGQHIMASNNHLSHPQHVWCVGNPD